MHLCCHQVARDHPDVMVCSYCTKRRPVAERVKTKTCPYCPADDSKGTVAYRCGNCFNFPHVTCLQKLVTPGFVKSVLIRRSLCLECYQQEVNTGEPLIFDRARGWGTAEKEVVRLSFLFSHSHHLLYPRKSSQQHPCMSRR